MNHTFSTRESGFSLQQQLELRRLQKVRLNNSCEKFVIVFFKNEIPWFLYLTTTVLTLSIFNFSPNVDGASKYHEI